MKLKIVFFMLSVFIAGAQCFAADSDPARWKKVKTLTGSLNIDGTTSTTDTLGGLESTRNASFNVIGTVELTRTSLDEYGGMVIFEGTFSGTVNFTGSSGTKGGQFGLDNSADCQGQLDEESQARLTIDYKAQRYSLQVSGNAQCSAPKMAVSGSDIKKDLEMSPGFSFSAFFPIEVLGQGGLLLPDNGEVIQKSSKMMVVVGTVMVPPFLSDGSWRLEAKKGKTKVTSVPKPFDWTDYAQKVMPTTGMLRCLGEFKENSKWGENEEKPDQALPDIAVEYNSEKDEWVITKITVHCTSLLKLPQNEGAYPQIDVNVTDDPNSRGYWLNVVQNLCTYSKPGSDQLLQWCVKGATEEHEKVHFDLYCKFVEDTWNKSARVQLEKELTDWLENYPDASDEAVALLARTKFMQKIAKKPDTAAAADAATAKRYAEEAKKIFDRFNKDKTLTFPCADKLK